MNIRIGLNTYYSDGDEKRFFDGLTKNPAVSGCRGIGRGLDIRLNARALSNGAARDLIALLWRYRISLKPLAILFRDKKYSWTRDKEAYWYKSLYPKK